MCLLHYFLHQTGLTPHLLQAVPLFLLPQLPLLFLDHCLVRIWILNFLGNLAHIVLIDMNHTLLPFHLAFGWRVGRFDFNTKFFRLRETYITPNMFVNHIFLRISPFNILVDNFPILLKRQFYIVVNKGYKELLTE